MEDTKSFQLKILTTQYQEDESVPDYIDDWNEAFRSHIGEM